MKHILFVVLTLCAGMVRVAIAAGPIECNDTIDITSLPYTIPYNDTCYCLTDSLKSVDDGITFSNRHNILLDLGGYSIQFDTNGSGNSKGINLNGLSEAEVYDITIKNGIVYHAEGAGTEGGSHNYAMYGNMCWNLLFDSVTFISDGFDGHAVWLYPNQFMKLIRFRKCTFTFNSNSFTSREAYGGSSFRASGGWQPFDTVVVGDSFHIKLDTCDFTAAPQNGIAFTNLISVIRGCSLYVDAQNVYWDTIYLDNGVHAGVGKSADNCYAILTSKTYGGTLIQDNKVISGNTHSGSRGIFVEDTKNTTAENPIVVRGNYLDLHSGPTGEELSGTLWGLRGRNLEAENTTQYVYFVGNTVYITVDDDPATPHIGTKGNAINVNYFQSSQGYMNHVHIDSNIVYARSLDSTIDAVLEGGEGCYAMTLAVFGNALPVDTTGSSVRGNQLYSCGVPLGFRWDPTNDGIGARNVVTRENIIGFMDVSTNDSLQLLSNRATIWTGGNSYYATQNELIDATYENGADEDDVSAEAGLTYSTLYKKTCSVYVKDNLGDPIEGATVRAITDAGDVSWSAATDANGLASGLTMYKYDSVGTSADSNYNPFNLRAIYGTDSVTVSRTVAPDNNDTTIVLTAELSTGLYGNSRVTGNAEIK